MSKIGIIQSRGLGDLVIALPIAWEWKKEGKDVLWPICQEFYSHMKDVAPWVQWIPVPTDAKGDFFYKEPEKRLRALKCDDIVCLYQSLNVIPELSRVPWFQIQKFDEFKYTKAGVPFNRKWQLAECITRNTAREQALYDKLVKNENYVVYHTVGSSYKCDADLSAVPDDWQRIQITEATDSVFDWLKIMEGAQALILIDSIFSNLADQLDMDVDKYWIPRSHIHLTPVLGSAWTILDPPEDSLAAKIIFQPG